jgi:hypothetical protein
MPPALQGRTLREPARRAAAVPAQNAAVGSPPIGDPNPAGIW